MTDSGLKVELISVLDLKENPRNPRVNDSAVMAVVKSIQEFGFNNPILTDGDLMIVAGHTRLKAALNLGMEYVPVIRISGLTGTKFTGYSIADNQTANIATWDESMLSEIVASLNDLDFDVKSLGFSDSELDTILQGLGGGKEGSDEKDDVIPPVPEEPVTQIDDLWILGGHRLLCGDAMKKEDIERLMDGEKVGLCVTSPPYFNQRDYSFWESYEKYLGFVRSVVEVIPMLENSIVVINIGSDEPAHHWLPSDWWQILRDNGWIYQEAISWVKSAAVWSVPRSMHIEKGHYFPALRWEVLLVVRKGKHPSFDTQDRDLVREFDENVWEFPVVSGQCQESMGHPAMFPTEIPRRCCLAYTKRDSSVFDPFVGSGTTIIACEKLGRRCLAMEIEPKYCDVAVKRWEDYTGQKAERIA